MDFISSELKIVTVITLSAILGCISLLYFERTPQKAVCSVVESRPQLTVCKLSRH